MSTEDTRRFYDGGVPTNGTLCETFHGFPNSAGEPETWRLYLRQSECTAGWLAFKLVAEGRVPVKANYWLGWSMRDARFNFRSDAGKLISGRPELAEKVREAIEMLVEEYVNPGLGDIEPGDFYYRGQLPPGPLMGPTGGTGGSAPPQAKNAPVVLPPGVSGPPYLSNGVQTWGVDGGDRAVKIEESSGDPDSDPNGDLL